MSKANHTEDTMTASQYKLVASNGRHIRIATKVTFDDGYEIAYLERMSKRAALADAKLIHLVHRQRHMEPSAFAAYMASR